MTENKYCKFLINGLSFHQENVRHCTTLQLGELISTYNETPQELAQKILELRTKIRTDLDNNIIPSGCQNCIYKNNESISSDKITKIDLFYWYHCNCGCFYCTYREETKGNWSDKEKEGSPVIFDTIKELYRLDEIDKEELNVVFGGGELGVLKEFPKLVDLFLKNNVRKIWCESSGIKYSKAVEKLLKSGKCFITVAVCCGSKEIYKKIKNRDKYTQVMNNLKKYVKSAAKFNENNKLCVVSKFIILQGFNNTKEELENWLQESKKYGLCQVEISMEFCWGIKTKAGQKVEDYNYELFDYAEKRCKELGLLLRKNVTSLALMKQGTY